MSDDKSTKSPDSTNNPSASQPRQQEDFIASVRRFADEHISAALHSVFGIPSILQTPQSSNWIREETERNRFENMNRREGGNGGDEPRTSSDRDGGDGKNNGGGSSGSGVSGFGGGSGGSGQNPSSPSSSDTSSNKDRDDEIILTITLPNIPMPPEVLLPEPLFNIGLRAIDLLDRNLSGHISQLEKLIDEEMERQKELSTAKQRTDYGIFQNDFERLLDMEARVKEARASRLRDGVAPEAVIVKGTQINGGEPKFSVTRQTGQQQSSILKELFGEDMYGAQRKHPLFTSFFDEFLPDGRYNEREQPPPEVVGGWKTTTQSTIAPIFPLQENPLGQIFKMMMAPWIQKIYESSDSSRFDIKGRVMNRVKNDIWNDKREDNPSFEEFQKLMHEERNKAAKERMQQLAEKRQELDKMIKENMDQEGNPPFEEFQKLIHEERNKAALRMQQLVEKQQDLDKIVKEKREREGDPSFEEFQKLMQEERKKVSKRMQQLVEKRQDLDEIIKGNTEREGNVGKLLEGVRFPNSNSTEKTEEEREPKTELELHDFFAGLTGKDKPRTDNRVLISESMSTTARTEADGITRLKKVRERRYSDGTLEREEYTEENAAGLGSLLGTIRRFDPPTRRNGNSDNHPVIRAIEEHKKQSEAHPAETKVSPAVTPESKDDDDTKNGGWGSWLWASGKKKD
ncbi:hypothetical protein TWF102_008612 [Orbilia oligospora]|uniref:Uncharacterized protein n=1 Tax=Orbilia oligospora TaxID=2813651 RepID=A0A7C8ND22_ORBOL|nr:hypothetical protein TWF102_008612 [Orbilia oligospora]KAF3113704.1 hypothetical protein TWF103_002055 [Orbilia oligospora]